MVKNIDIDDTRSIREIVEQDGYSESDIKDIREYLQIKDNKGAKALIASIILSAINDIDELDERIKMFEEKCAGGRLKDYLKNKRDRELIPYSKGRDMSALKFFDSEYGKMLLEEFNLRVLPKEFREKIDRLTELQRIFNKHCKHCIKEGESFYVDCKKLKEKLEISKNASK